MRLNCVCKVLTTCMDQNVIKDILEGHDYHHVFQVSYVILPPSLPVSVVLKKLLKGTKRTRFSNVRDRRSSLGEVEQGT
jgi:hypothetical protein